MQNARVPPKSHCWRSRLKYIAIGTGSAAMCYGMGAYLLLPALWRHYERNPQLETLDKITRTKEGIPGDPVNIAVVGARSTVVNAMLQAGWYPADPITVKTSIGIAKSVLLKKSYPTAPVSNLYIFGRKQDLAFERPAGNSANRRHHVRFWESPTPDDRTKLPLWVGSATFDRSSGLSHRTGQITHHIDADIDFERDTTIEDLAAARQINSIYQVTGIGATFQGRNGGGDPYYTDGEMTIAVLSPDNAPVATPDRAPNPPAIEAKHHFWQWWRRSILGKK